MKFWILAAAACLALPTAALACSCMNTDNPQQLRAFAADAAKDAVALVEVETILAFQDSAGAGDRMRVIRPLAGSVQGEFRVERRAFPSGASCDQIFDKGQRGLVILYPSARSGGGEPIYRISGLCTGLMLERPVFRDELVRQIGNKDSTERG